MKRNQAVVAFVVGASGVEFFIQCVVTMKDVL